MNLSNNKNLNIKILKVLVEFIHLKEFKSLIQSFKRSFKKDYHFNSNNRIKKW